MKKQEWLCDTSLHNLRHRLAQQQPLTISSPFAPKQTHYSFSTIYLILAGTRCFRGAGRMGTCTITCFLKGFPTFLPLPVLHTPPSRQSRLLWRVWLPAALHSLVQEQLRRQEGSYKVCFQDSDCHLN